MAALLGEAFADDSYTHLMFGDAADAGKQVGELFGYEIRTQYLPHGVVDVAELDGEVAGAALWMPPSSHGGPLSSIRTIPAYARRLGWRYVTSLYGEWQSAKHHPVFPHWYLYLLGISPAAQGHGVGGALIDHGITRLAPDDAAYLESTTPGSARLYARHGFVPLGEVPLTRGKTMLGMWRPAARGPQPKP